MVKHTKGQILKSESEPVGSSALILGTSFRISPISSYLVEKVLTHIYIQLCMLKGNL